MESSGVMNDDKATMKRKQEVDGDTDGGQEVPTLSSPKDAHTEEEVRGPGPKDFVFIRRGQMWKKLREQTAWNSKRLAPIAAAFVIQPGSLEKRAYVKQHVISPVWDIGGRFLHPVESTGIMGFKWEEILDRESVITKVMQLLRQQHKYSETKKIKDGASKKSVASEFIATIESAQQDMQSLSSTVLGLLKSSPTDECDSADIIRAASRMKSVAKAVKHIKNTLIVPDHQQSNLVNSSADVEVISGANKAVKDTKPHLSV